MNRIRKFRIVILSVFLLASLILLFNSLAMAAPIVFSLSFGGTVSYAGGNSAFTTTNGAVTQVGNGSTTLSIAGGDLDFATGNYIGGGATADGFENIYAGGGSVTIHGNIGSGVVLLMQGRFVNNSTFNCCNGSSPVFTSSFGGIFEISYLDSNLAAALGFNLPAAGGSLAQVQIFFGASPSASGVAFSGTQGGGALSASEAEELQVSTIFPNQGGNTGFVSVVIQGKGFKPGATVKLTGINSDIDSIPPILNENGHDIYAKFDLSGVTLGTRDVVVTNPDGTSVVLSGSFTVEEAHAANVWVDIVGRNAIRAGRRSQFKIHYGNSGNVDAEGAYVMLGGIPKDATVRTDFGYTVFPMFKDSVEPVGPAIIFESKDEKILQFEIDTVPAGFTGTLIFDLVIVNTSAFELKTLVGSK